MDSLNWGSIAYVRSTWTLALTMAVTYTCSFGRKIEKWGIKGRNIFIEEVSALNMMLQETSRRIS